MTHRLSRRAALARLMTGACLPVLAGCEAVRVAEAPTRRPSEGGIGGTGIVGVLTDLGSLIINGLRVETGAETEVVGPDGPLPVEVLTPGLSLTVEAQGAPDALFARRVAVNPPLIGPIAIDATGGITVNGVAVRIDPAVPALISVGDRVVVSGLWDGTAVVASRLDATEPEGRDRIAGVVGIRATGQTTLGGRALRLPDAIARPAPGVFATAIGRDDGSAFVAEALELGRFSPGFRNLARLSVEGYLQPQAAAPGFSISGLGHSLDPAAQMAALEGQRSLIEGAYDGRFVAERGLLLPEALESRRAFLGLRLTGGVAPTISLR
ncbi:MAG: DUF5666 domain-containing protein [Pseudomonadota bacterium]